MIKRDLGKKTAFFIALLFVAVKLVLTYGQSVYLYEPFNASIDDALMLNTAMSVRQGNWLGEYNYLTLSKYMFFPVWLAFINLLGVPYLIAGQLLWAFACGFTVYAFLPVIKQNFWRLSFFCILLFNPAVSAAKVQLRAYRDNIFPALCTLCIAGFIAVALRHDKGIKKQILGLIVGGIGLGLTWTTREDGKWILAFTLCASIITGFVMLKCGKRIWHILTLCAPYVITGAIIMAFCTVNFLYYGRFILSDFTSAEFTAAYGAMSRVKHANWEPKVVLPTDVRNQLYDYVPEFALLKPVLETSPFYNGFGTGDGRLEFSTSGFYWGLRRAAQEIGVYQNAQTAKQYWQTVADKINALCDDGTLPAIGRRSSTLSPFNVKYILPTLKETALNMWRSVSFAEAEPAFEKPSEGYGTEILSKYEQFLGEKSNSVTEENSNNAYYSTKQKIAHFALSLIRVFYSVLTPAITFMALCALAYLIYSFYKHKKGSGLMLLIISGLFLSAVLRCAMIAYMFASAFNYNIERIMYLASVHPLLLVFGFISLYTFFTTINFKEIKRG